MMRRWEREDRSLRVASTNTDVDVGIRINGQRRRAKRSTVRRYVPMRPVLVYTGMPSKNELFCRREAVMSLCLLNLSLHTLHLVRVPNVEIHITEDTRVRLLECMRMSDRIRASIDLRRSIIASERDSTMSERIEHRPVVHDRKGSVRLVCRRRMHTTSEFDRRDRSIGREVSVLTPSDVQSTRIKPQRSLSTKLWTMKTQQRRLRDGESSRRTIALTDGSFSALKDNKHRQRYIRGNVEIGGEKTYPQLSLLTSIRKTN